MNTDIYVTVFENELIETKPTHKYKLGDLVELENGTRSYVTRLCYDCDGSPLYGFSIEPKILWIGEKISRSICGYNENSIKRLISHTDVILCFMVDGNYQECYLKYVLPLIKKEKEYQITVDIECSTEILLKLNVEE